MKNPFNFTLSTLRILSFAATALNPFAANAQAAYWAHAPSSDNFSFANAANWSSAISGKTTYIGIDNSGLNASSTKEFIILDDDVNIANLYWGASYYQNPASVLNPVLNANLPAGIIDNSKNYTITLNNGSGNRQLVVYKGYSEDLTFSCNFQMGGSGGNTLARFSSDCNTTFSDGYTIEASRNLTFYMYHSQSDIARGNLYINSAILAPETSINFNTTNISGDGAGIGEIILGGTSSNIIKQLRLYLETNITFAKTDGAKAFLGNGGDGGARTIYLCGSTSDSALSDDSHIKYLHSDQMQNARIVAYTHADAGSTAKGGIVLANSSSQNVGGIDNFILSNFNAKDGNLLAYVDFTKNSDAQIFAVKTLSTSGIIQNENSYVIKFALYNFGQEDKFVYGEKLSDSQKEWIYFYSDDGIRLIDWSDILEDVYADFDGVTYYAYSIIPEPSYCAALFAAFALFFAIFIKSKKQ